MPSAHLPGRPVSAWTYGRHGCRCDGCRKAAVENTRRWRRRPRRQDPMASRIRRVAFYRAEGII